MTYETNGYLVTDTRTSDFKATEISLSVTVPTNTQIDVTVYQDLSGGTIADNTETLTDVSSGATSLSNFESAQGSTYWLRFDLTTTDDSETPTVDFATLYLGKRLSVTYVIDGNGDAQYTRTASKNRPYKSSSNGDLTLSRSVRKRRIYDVDANSKMELLRSGTRKSRSYEQTNDSFISLSIQLTNSLRGERTRDLQWDYIQSESAYVSEWFPEDGVIHDTDVGGYGVTVDGEIDVWVQLTVQYDETGDGTVDGEIGPQYITSTDELFHTDNLGVDGQYRLLLRDVGQTDRIVKFDKGSTY